MNVSAPASYQPAAETTARARAWRGLAYVYAVAWAATAAWFLFHVPFEAAETSGNLRQFLSAPPAHRLFIDTFTMGAWPQPGFLRTFSYATSKLVFDASAGQYFAMYRALHAALLLVLMLCLARLVRVTTPLGLGLVMVASAALLGLHTFHEAVNETELNIKLLVPALCFGIVCLSASKPHWSKDVAAVALTFYAVFSNELGLLVWVCVAAGYLVGLRGVSRTGALGATAALGVYFVCRFVLWGVGSPGLEERNSGFGFSMLETSEIMERFGANPLPLYAYNVAASALTVLCSEPRSGVFVFVRELLNGAVPPGLVLHVGVSLLTTGLMAWFAAKRAHRWVARDFTHDDSLFLVAIAAIGANAVISFPYLKDVTMSTAGAFYAVAMVPPLRLFAARLIGRRVVFWRGAVACALLGLVSMGWTLRAASLYVHLSRDAPRLRQEWSAVAAASEAGRVSFPPAEAALIERVGTEMGELTILPLSAAPAWVDVLDPLH